MRFPVFWKEFDRSLSDTLKTLEDHKMVTRIIEETRPPKVHYPLK